MATVVVPSIIDPLYIGNFESCQLSIRQDAKLFTTLIQYRLNPALTGKYRGKVIYKCGIHYS